MGPDLDNNLKASEKIFCHHPYLKANTIAEYLKNNMNCDLVICLSHLGNEKIKNTFNNQDFAANSKYIDVIIGGHGKTMCLEPLISRNKIGEEIFISQAGWDGLMLRKLSFTFNENGKSKFDVNNFIPGVTAQEDVYKEYRKLIA